MSYNQLTENERYQIDAYIKAGFTQKEIAEQLQRSPSTISRELKKKYNSGNIKDIHKINFDFLV